MREIKFRAWHTELKRMIPCQELVEDQMTLLADGRFINVSSVRPSMSQIVPQSVMIPLQFTGLLDKNRCEIYEGDIVKRTDYEQCLEITFGWGDDNEGYCESYGWLYAGGVFDGSSHYKCNLEMEVIGNIYENPELLK